MSPDAEGAKAFVSSGRDIYIYILGDALNANELCS